MNRRIREPDDAMRYNARGVSKAKLGDYPGAIADFDTAIHLKPDYAIAYYNRGRAMAELRQTGHVELKTDTRRLIVI